MLQALVFDFDGLVADTETPEFESWSAEFLHHGVELSISEWIQCVGTGPSAWDVYDHLESLVGSTVDRAEVEARRRGRYLALTTEIGVMPGVARLLEEAWMEDLPCAVASSSKSEWVVGYLELFGLADRFRAVVTRDQVARVKPAPDLYLAACSIIGVEPSASVALEDSANGVSSARAAGLYCIVVPNSITSMSDLDQAHHRVDSVEELTIANIQGLLAREPLRARF